MADPFIGEIRAFGFNFPPEQWASCDGALLPIQQNTSLFSILRTNYGGNGSSTFGLPDLKGRAVVGAIDGQMNAPQGTMGISLNPTEMPAHIHTLKVAFNQSKNKEPKGRLLSKLNPAANTFVTFPAAPAPTLTSLYPATVLPIGAGTPHENRQPYQVLNFCIAQMGVWPQRP